MVDSSLDDIKRALFPTFSPHDISRLDANTTLVRDVHGVSYLPGQLVLLWNGAGQSAGLMSSHPPPPQIAYPSDQASWASTI